MRRHLTRKQLTLLADAEELTKRAQRRAPGHLARCTKCRDELRFIRELGEGLRQIEYPRPPEGLLQEILQRRRAGERRITPGAQPWHAEPRWRPHHAVLVLGLLGGAVASYLLMARSAVAGAGDNDILCGDARLIG